MSIKNIPKCGFCKYKEVKPPQKLPDGETQEFMKCVDCGDEYNPIVITTIEIKEHNCDCDNFGCEDCPDDCELCMNCSCHCRRVDG